MEGRIPVGPQSFIAGTHMSEVQRCGSGGNRCMRKWSLRPLRWPGGAWSKRVAISNCDQLWPFPLECQANTVIFKMCHEWQRSGSTATGLVEDETGKVALSRTAFDWHKISIITGPLGLRPKKEPKKNHLIHLFLVLEGTEKART